MQIKKNLSILKIQSIVLLVIFADFSGNCLGQKAVTRLPADSLYKNRSGKTQWILTSAALDTFTVNMIQNRSCRRINDSMQVQVKLLGSSQSICNTALNLRSKEALMWHNKLDSTDLKLQNTEIKLEQEKRSKSKWQKATFGSIGAAVIFIITSIILAVK